MLGTPNDDEWTRGGVVDDNGNTYVIVNESGYVGAEVVKLNKSGDVEWKKSLGADTGSSSFLGKSITMDEQKNIYVAGQTNTALGDQNYNGGDLDAVLMKIDGESKETKWIRILGTSGQDAFLGVALDKQNERVHAAGYAEGALGNNEFKGGIDAVISSYDQSGEIRRVNMFGTEERDRCLKIISDARGKLYLEGYLNYGASKEGFIKKNSDLSD